MAYKVFEDFTMDSVAKGSSSDNINRIILQGEGQEQVELPDASYVRDADITRDGVALVLETPEGTVIIEGYYAVEPTPNLTSPDGVTLTPELVHSFSNTGNQYADAGLSMNDASPVGAIQEISGEATVTRQNGSVEVMGIGTPIYQGDIIETDEDGAVNIMFIDETTFAVSEDARLSIDEYVFDPATQSGTTNFSVLKGVFVFTSGLIGRDDPDDVMIDTPSGSIGIRGTIIAGDVDTGEITVIEGAIVLHDFSGNTVTLANQYETARFNPSESTIDHMGDLSATDVTSKFMSVSTVAADLFSSIQDSATETGQNNQSDAQQESSPENSDPVDNQSANEVNPLEEIIVSDDIVSNPANTLSSGLTKTVTEVTTTSSGTDTQEIQPIMIVQEPVARPPFQIIATKLAVGEGVNGADVARITGGFTNHTNLNLVGAANNYYDVIREGENSFLIKLKAGVSLDAERPYKLILHGTNETGSISVTRSVDLDILNVDEPTFYTGLATNVSATDNFFSGSGGSTFGYNFSREFADFEGDITGYQLITAPAHADVLGHTFDTGTGIMTMNIDSAIDTAFDTFNFTVRALSTSGNVDHTFTFDLYDNNLGTGSNTVTGASDIYSGTDASVTIAAGNVTVFTDADATNNTVDISGTGSYIKTGAGDDTFNIFGGSTGYHTYGDSGDDTFNISEALGKSYGGVGNDQFILQNTGSVVTLEGAGAGAVVIDGGSGLDLLQMATAGNIDFGAVDSGFIKNIEKIAFINGGTNIIQLNYDDVIDMTDNRNALVIDMDANDTLNFTNTSGNSFFSTGGTTIGTDNYDVYTDGTITLLVDTDNTAVTGL